MEKFKDYSVLVVEDDQAVKEGLSRILNMIFKKVKSVKDGYEALELIKNEGTDLIITDLLMPHLNGLELIKALNESQYNIPVIITTACTENEYFENAKNLGVENYLLKPIDIEDLISACKTIFSSKI